MIECTNEFIWYKKRKKRLKNKCFFTIVIIIILIVGLFYWYRTSVCKQIFNVFSDYSFACSTEITNDAVLLSLKDKINYSDLITVEKDSNGNVSLMSINVYKVNKIGRQIVNETNKKLSAKLKNGVDVPLLAFTGIDLLSGYGNAVNIKNINVVSVDCKFDSKFISCGINQTLHSIYVDVTSIIKLEVPFNNKTINNSTKIVICESVLVGKVPDTYLNGNIFNGKP